MNVSLGSWSRPFTPWRPADGRVFDMFAYDVETTKIDDERPYLTPAYVLGAACDEKRGVFICRDNAPAFFQAHQGVEFVCHNAAFDLKVTAPLLQPKFDLYRAVDDDRVWDTMVLKRLLSLATAGHTARSQSSLPYCAWEHLGVELDKGQTDTHGDQVRTGFGRFLGRPPEEIPPQHLAYLACDALATWLLFKELNRLIREVLQNSYRVWGYVNSFPRRYGEVNKDWVRDAVRRFGPLTHHVQLRASILMDALRSNGIGVDRTRREEKATKVREVLEACKERMRTRDHFLVDQEGSVKAMQSKLQEFHRLHPEVELARTESGERWSTAEEDLAELAQQDPFFRDYALYRQCEKLLSTYLNKMGPARIHPCFGFLLETGRTFCSGCTLQNLPNERALLKEDPDAATVRGCFVPGEGSVFLDADYGQIELVTLAYALEKQFGLKSNLAQLINNNNDVHRLIAGAVLGKDPQEVSKDERNSAKPVSFGRPGGMGVPGLRQVAKSGYGIDLTDEEVQRRIDAYHALCPELDRFLKDEVDVGEVLAAELGMTPVQYYEARGFVRDPLASANGEHYAPASWLGWMLLKVLRDETPTTGSHSPRPYAAEEISFFWDKAQALLDKLEPREAAKLRGRQPDGKLGGAVRDRAGRRPVFTVTGRLRANATFCSSRNNIFQGTAADGALLGLWLVWRAGYRIVSFVHDQLVVESPADDRVKERVEDIERLMRQGMHQVVPGMLVKVETAVTCSLNKNDLDPHYDPKTKERVGEALPDAIVTAPG
jgi:hypothetical protein